MLNRQLTQKFKFLGVGSIDNLTLTNRKLLRPYFVCKLWQNYIYIPNYFEGKKYAKLQRILHGVY